MTSKRARDIVARFYMTHAGAVVYFDELPNDAERFAFALADASRFFKDTRKAVKSADAQRRDGFITLWGKRLTVRG